MSVIATAVRHLMAAGVTGEALISAIADMEASQPRDAVAEKRRAYDRERKRARKSTGIPPETAESVETPALDKESFPQTPFKEINPTRGGIALPRKAGGFSAPEGVKHETWVAFCQQRKKAVTRIAFDRIVKTLAEGADAGWPPGEIAERAVERGYETFFIPSEKPNVRNRPANDRPSAPINPMVAAGIAREARFASGGAPSG